MKGLESLPQNLERRQKTLHPRPSNEIHGTKERGALQCAWRRQELKGQAFSGQESAHPLTVVAHKGHELDSEGPARCPN